MRSPRRGYALVLAAAAAWSTTGLWIRKAAESGGFSALSLAFWRDLATALSLIAGLALLRPAWLRVQRRDLPWLVALGGLGVGTFHVLWNLSLLHLDVAIATVLLYSAPVFVTLAARLIWHEPLTRPKIVAVILTLAGCVLAAGLDPAAGLSLTAGGLILGLSAALAYASFSLFSRHMTGRYSPWTVLTYGFGFGALVLLPFQLLSAPPAWPLPPQTWGWMAGLVYLCTILPFGAYLSGMLHLPVSVASILAASEVVFAAVLGYLVFDETLRGWQVVGAALVVAGVILLAVTGRTEQTVKSA